MKLYCCTDSLEHLACEDMLDYLSARGVKAVEMTTVDWSPALYVRMDELLADASARERFLPALSSRDMEVAALDCSGNPLDPSEMGQEHKAVSFKTMGLAGLLGVKKNSCDERPASRVTGSYHTQLDYLYGKLAPDPQGTFGLPVERCSDPLLEGISGTRGTTWCR